MRSWSFFALSSLLAACSQSGAAAPDVAADLAPEAADVAVDLAPDLAPDVPLDAGADGSCQLDSNPIDTGGPLHGFIRFVHVGRALGPLRFTATSIPGFAPARVEAVVREGESTEQIRTLPVAYEIHVTPAGDAAPGVVVDASHTDAGMLTDGPGSPATACDASRGPTEVVPPICTDVYFIAGCTVALAGSARGSAARDSDRRLHRISDIPVRTNECDVGQVRTFNLYAEGPAVDVDRVGGDPISRLTNFRETSGLRNVPVGPLRVAVRVNGTRMPLGEHLAGVINPGHAHTLYIWGDALNMASPGVGALVVDDVTPTLR